MKKQQKIIELRTEAKLKVAELETKIAVARSEAASERARLLWERAGELEGLEAGSTERFDALAKYKAKLAGVEEKLAARVAQLKADIMQIKAKCEQQCAAAEDDPEPETDNDTDTDVTVKGFQPQETVYCDGSEHSARIVARRLIKKMPHFKSGYFQTSVTAYSFAGNHMYYVDVWCGNRENCFNTSFLRINHTAEFEAEFFEKAREFFNSEEQDSNSHVAEPMARALDAVFGGNPVEEFDNLISDTVKDRKDGGNE